MFKFARIFQMVRQFLFFYVRCMSSLYSDGLNCDVVTTPFWQKHRLSNQIEAI